MRIESLIIVGMLLTACARTPMFPPDVTKNISQEFDFNDWKQMSYEGSPDLSRLPRKVQLGGEIINVDKKTESILIVGDKLPIVDHPKFGPQKVKRVTESTFAIQFPKALDPTWVQRGNFFIVVGKPDGVRPVMVDDVPRNEPFLLAECIHIWKNQGRDIASFPYETGAGYYPLEEETFCVTSR